MHDLIILGGGPAGLTATIYALRKRLDTLLITRDLGGKTNYRLQIPDMDRHLVLNGEEVINRFVNEIEYLDFVHRLERVENVERGTAGFVVHTREGGSYAGRTLIVATGARAQRLDVPGEREFLMRGVCNSATSYAPLFFGREAVVIGSGEVALHAALELARIARQVTLVAPKALPGGRLARPAERLRALPNVLVLEGFTPLRVEGDTFARRLISVSADGEQCTLEAAAFFVELGLQPNSDAVRSLVALDDQGRVKVDSRSRTSHPGIFAAGDVTDAPSEQVLIAIGEGAKAALAAHEYLLELPAEEAVTAEEWR